MTTLRTGRALIFTGIQVHPTKHVLHVTNVLAELIPGLAQTFGSQSTNFADNICVSFLIWKPPMFDFWCLPDGSESGSESRRDEVSVQSNRSSWLALF